jgi:ABC-type glycerol-3-phosphate transport system substrate-binding protein
MLEVKKRFILGSVISALAISLVLGGCGSKSSSASKNDLNKDQTITFVNHKTDWASNGKWKSYMKEFNKKYPHIHVKIETFTNYDKTESTRLNSKNYGDVSMIPSTVAVKNLSHFYVSFGKLSQLSKKYSGLSGEAYNGEAYGIPSQINATGLIVNKKVFEDAGYSSAIFKSPSKFVAALKAIKQKEKGVIPLYTNYHSGWALVDWDMARIGVSGNANFTNEMASDANPFTKGKTMYSIYSLLYTIAHDGLVESDPTTSDWEQSLSLMAHNKIGAMVLGSWAIPQVQALSKSNAKYISFAPLPFTAKNGKQYITAGPDYMYGVSVHSQHQAAAKALVNWLVKKSNYAKDNGGLSAVKGSKYPQALSDLKENNIKLLYAASAPKGKETLFNDVNNASEVGIDTSDDNKEKIIDAGTGNSGQSFESIMKSLNADWGKAVKQYNN